MKTYLLPPLSGVLFTVLAVTLLQADQLEMQNGDRYHGKVLSVSTDTVVLESDIFGKLTIPRRHVAGLSFGTNAALPRATANGARIAGMTNLPAVSRTNRPAITNVDLSAAFRNLGADTNFVRQIREQMLSDSPEAANKYTEMVSGLMSGKLNLNDLRREAKSSADQLRAFKRELGPEAGDSLDMYLQVLDGFLKESGTEPTSAKPVSPPKGQGR